MTQAEEIVELEDKLLQVVITAEHLFAMVPDAVWRESWGDDGQGHYEGFYFAELTQTSIKEWRDYVDRRRARRSTPHHGNPGSNAAQTR